MASPLPPRRVSWSVLAILVIAGPGWGVARGAERSPFIPEVEAPVAVSGASNVLQGFEFAGYVRMGDELQVYLCQPGTRRGHWLALGVASEGLLVEEFDADRQSVRVRAGAHARWLKLRGVTIAPVVMVLRDDRSIDWDHMQLSNRQKELKAAGQMWDLMEISRQVRRPEVTPPPQTGSREPPDRISPGS